MTENVLIACINGFTAIVVSVVGIVQWRSHRQQKQTAQVTERIRHQVENDHPKNFRDEQDERWKIQQAQYNTQLEHNTIVINAISAMRKQLNKTSSRTNQLWSRYARK